MDLNSAEVKDGEQVSYPEQLARYVGAFFDELIRGGVQDVVISPGSRSTPLSMMAFASSLNAYVDVDERGAAFFALGLAKATGRAVAVICTSGTAVANYYPAVLEAEASRVPLLVLSGDRPARLQQLGAPQTCDQLKIFGDHVRQFWNMPEANGSRAQIRYARQIAREALVALDPQTLTSAPVHINFPFDEPLTPQFSSTDAFSHERVLLHEDIAPFIDGNHELDEGVVSQFEQLFVEKRVIALCGEGTLGVFDAQDPSCWVIRNERAHQLCAWAHRYDIPLLADPLSQLRNFSDDAIIDNYDNIFGRDDRPNYDVVIRFGRYPVSKRISKELENTQHIQIVVDPVDTRDFNSTTTTLVKTTPVAFVESFRDAMADKAISGQAARANEAIAEWSAVNARERTLICSVKQACYVQVCTAEGCREEEVPYEGAYIQALLDMVPGRSLLFSANSMAIRALDTFYVKPSEEDKTVVHLEKHKEEQQRESGVFPDCSKSITILANRGLNGIDGTLSSAIGAAQAYDQAFFLTGDLTLLHDLNALTLNGELFTRSKEGKRTSSIVVVLFNNNGGGIFERLSQRSNEAYFNRLFLTPQKINFQQAASAFEVPYQLASNLKEFCDTLASWIGDPGVHLVEVDFSLEDLDERFRVFQ